MPSPASKVANVRIVRKSGAYRQSFRVENANRRARGAAPITVSHPDCNSDAEAIPRNGRLKVVTSREFSPVVPFWLGEGKFSYEDAPNPVNQTGALLADQVPVVTSNDFESFLAAFGKRCNFEQLGKDDDIEDDVFDEALAIISRLPPALWEVWEEDDECVKRWMDKFDPAKAARMKAAEDRIPECSARYLGKKDLSVKLEVLLKRSDPTWAPRVIYAGNDEFNRVTGPAMMVVMERLQELTSKYKIGDVKVKLAYKTTDVACAEFLDHPEYPRAYEGDFSANDKEQRSRVALIFDKMLEKLCMPTWLRNLMLEMQCFRVENRRFGVAGEIKYQLPTGTTATTARNSVYNAVMFAVACARQHVPGARAVILGDDILAVMAHPFSVVKWKEVVDRFKMKLKGKSVELNGQATLLSRRLVIFGDTRCMMPLIGKALARFNARGTLNEAVSDSQYMAGKALSYAYEFRHVPFMRDAFLRRYEKEDVQAVTLDDLTWFTKSSGIELSNIVAAIRDEPVTISDDVFLDWLMDTYDLGLCEMAELLELVVGNDQLEFIEHYAVDNLSIDW